jgi:hypothetical protein
MSDFLDLKLARRFATWDRDGNGFLEEADFVKGADRLGEAFGHAEDSPQRRRMRDLCLDLWQQMARIADFDRNGRITPEEYGRAFSELVLVKPGAFDAAYTPVIDALTAMADHDGDGKLDQQEYRAWFVSAFGLSEHDADTAFDKVDSDHDGHVTRSEMVAAIHDYYFSDDPEAPGNWLLGPPPQS